MPRKKPLYAPMLATFGGGSIQGFKSGGGSSGLTLAEHYAANTTAGLQEVLFNGNTYTLNYATHASKGWVEILFHANVSAGHHLRDDQGNFINAGGTGTPLFYQVIGSEYFMISENTTLGGTALDYTANFSQIMIGNDITPTDLVVTSKSNKSLAQINPATGENQNSALPLRANYDLSGSEVTQGKAALFNFFKGTGGGVSGFYNSNQSWGAQSSKHYEMYWNKAGYGFAIVLFNRGGTPQTDHWMIASGESQSTATYYANIGYRGYSGSSWTSHYVGSWYPNASTPHSSQYYIATDNVLSVWLTDM
jgi:hypothetical protein